MKHLKKSQKKSFLDLISKILFIIEAVAMVGVTVYMAITQLFPIKYLLVLFLLFVSIAVFNISMLLMKTKGNATKIVSLVLSIVVLFVSTLGTVYLGTIHNSFSKIPDAEVEHEATKTDVSKKPFVVYLSGIDTRGSTTIKDKALSDVNMVVIVNPKTAKILMVNIPRDYYLPLEGDKNKMDKLTHAGSKGVACSMKTLEALFDVDFNYYVKVNFQSVVDIVDHLGGITVDSDIAFSSKYALTEDVYYHFKKGENKLTGLSALAFARERESLAGGDRDRGKHQQMVIKAIIEKATSPSNLTPNKISKLVDCITENTNTNISYDEISTLVKLQLDKMPSWDIQSISVDGTGSTQPTYTTGGLKAYVMIPTQSTVDEAKLKIKEVLGK